MGCNGFRFTSSAEEDLDGILDYITNRLSNPIAAASFYSELTNEINGICNYPGSGSPVDNDFISDKRVRKVLVGNYIMFYRFLDDINKIEILRIIYGKRNPDKFNNIE